MAEQKIRESDYDDVRARYAAGDTLEAIGDAYGCSRERVRQLLPRLGLVARGKAWKREQFVEPPERVKAVLAAWTERLCVNAVAEKAGTYPAAVRRILKAHGLAPWPKVAEHGGGGLYNKGCRCVPCVEGNRERTREHRRAAIRRRKEAGTCLYCPRGKRAAGCLGCRRCLDAHAANHRDWLERKAAEAGA